MPPLREIDIVKATALWLAREGWKVTCVSPNEDREGLLAELVRAGLGRDTIRCMRHGPDIEAERGNEVWRIECKHAGSGRQATIRNHFDRALASAVSYFDPPPARCLRLGLALPDHPDFLRDLRNRVPRPLRVALSLWVLLVMKDGVRAFKPETERFPDFAGLSGRRRASYTYSEEE